MCRSYWFSSASFDRQVDFEQDAELDFEDRIVTVKAGVALHEFE